MGIFTSCKAVVKSSKVIQTDYQIVRFDEGTCRVNTTNVGYFEAIFDSPCYRVVYDVDGVGMVI